MYFRWQKAVNSMDYQMRFKHFPAVKTLNGKSRWQAKKCLFSVTRTSAPTHSVYAAINASAVLKPFSSYLNAISKGIIKCDVLLIYIRK